MKSPFSEGLGICMNSLWNWEETVPTPSGAKVCMLKYVNKTCQFCESLGRDGFRVDLNRVCHASRFCWSWNAAKYFHSAMKHVCSGLIAILWGVQTWLTG